MFRYLLILSCLFLIFSFSIRNSKLADPAQETRRFYKQKVDLFKTETTILYKLTKKNNEKLIQQQFLKTRYAYKQIEIFTEYFFPFYAGKLNGLPIPFYEEAEPDKMEQLPTGMQVIESYIFPGLNKQEKKRLQAESSELVRYANELSGVNESHEFNETNIFDAIIEQLYRITALGITGFDSQAAFNSLAECRSSLNSIQQILSFFSDSLAGYFPHEFPDIVVKLKNAQAYLATNIDFNTFNRMEFIQQYLNPVTTIVGRYKISKDYKDNPGALFYAAINKNGIMFSPAAFDPYRFLDDYTTSTTKIELGRKLFFEKRLSSNSQRSCASCHQPGKAFTDGLRTSTALDGHSPLLRNAPTILNAALQRNLFSDSRSRTLEEQVMQVLDNAQEMHASAKETAQKIVNLDEYKILYKQAYPNSPLNNAAKNVCNAIASYERTLIALNAPFDQHMNGSNVLSKDEINGFNLFMGKAKCGTCHFMPLFSGAKPPRYYFVESEVIGVPATSNPRNASLDKDSGRFRITGLPLHMFSFKTPTLRNAALTAPYMHNGVFNSLEEVVEFYNNGGGKGLGIAPPNQSLPFEKLNLTKQEEKNIIQFIKSLTDTTVVTK